MKYNKLTKKGLLDYFDIIRTGKRYNLKYIRSYNSINIKIPFLLNEDVAKLAGLMPDGSLIKDLRRIYFHQKKDMSKIYLFRDLLNKLFKPKNKIFLRESKGGFQVYINSSTLARFFYHILDINKSDEQCRIPKWIFSSSKSVKVAYLREAFAMEGTILKKLSEIRFISKDKDFIIDIHNLLLDLDISSTINKRIGGTPPGIQYRLSIYGKENFRKFKEIGFSYKFHKDRFEALKKKYNI